MADVLTATFEGGTPFSPFTSTSGSVSQDTGIFHGGAAAMKSDASSAAAYASKTLSSATLYVAQFWFYIPSSMPDGYSFALGRFGGTNLNCFFHVNDTTSQQIGAYLTDGATSSSHYAGYAENTWTRYTLRLNVVANPWVADWNLGTTEQTQVTFAHAATDLTLFDIGPGAGASGLITYQDDAKVGDATGDYATYIGAAPAAAHTMLLLGAG